MKLVKGSAEAKRFMAKIRAKKKPVKKATVKKLSGVKKNRSLGASGDYAKFEIAVIKNLSKLLKKPYKKVLEIVNTDESLLNIISKNFDKKISVSVTAKELKAKLITVAKKSPLQSFVEILNKLPKKDQVSRSVKFPIKLPATVSIGSNKNKPKLDINKTNIDYINYCLERIKVYNNWIEFHKENLRIPNDPYIKKQAKFEIKEYRNMIQEMKQAITKTKKHIK